jgi:hypothetical protein
MFKASGLRPHVLLSFYRKSAAAHLRNRGCLPAILLVYQGTLPCGRQGYQVTENNFTMKAPYTRLPPPSYSYELSFVPHGDTMAAEKPNHAIVYLYTYLRSYVKLGSEGVTIPFEYMHEMFRDRLLFQAVESDSRKQILFKFTRGYAVVMHKLLAEKQLAPQLYGYQLLPGGWTTLDHMLLNEKEYMLKIQDALDPLWKISGCMEKYDITISLFRGQAKSTSDPLTSTGRCG